MLEEPKRLPFPDQRVLDPENNSSVLEAARGVIAYINLQALNLVDGLLMMFNLFFHGVNNYSTVSPNFFTKTDYIAEIGSGSRFPSYFPSQIRIVKAWTCKSTIFRRQTCKIIIILLSFWLTLPIFLLSLIKRVH